MNVSILAMGFLPKLQKQSAFGDHARIPCRISVSIRKFLLCNHFRSSRLLQIPRYISVFVNHVQPILAVLALFFRDTHAAVTRDSKFRWALVRSRIYCRSQSRDTDALVTFFLLSFLNMKYYEYFFCNHDFSHEYIRCVKYWNTVYKKFYVQGDDRIRSFIEIIGIIT